jgi:hypothetical protein
MYRVSICVADHTVVGRQDRDLDPDLFASIVTGQHPQGDGDAHTRDSHIHGGQNRTCYYHGVWNPVTMSWITSADAAEIAALYAACDRPGFSG